MTRFVAALAFALCLFGSQPATAPVQTAPKNDIRIVTSVGNVAAREKVEVIVHSLVHESEIKHRVWIRNARMEDLWLEADDSRDAASVIENLLSKTSWKRVEDQRVGSATVGVVTDRDGKSEIRLASTMGALHQIEVDRDNAAVLVSLLRRAEQNIAWLEPRAKFLIPGSPEPVANELGEAKK